MPKKTQEAPPSELMCETLNKSTRVGQFLNRTFELEAMGSKGEVRQELRIEIGELLKE
jgi:hypothetical protein